VVIGSCVLEGGDTRQRARLKMSKEDEKKDLCWESLSGRRDRVKERSKRDHCENYTLRFLSYLGAGGLQPTAGKAMKGGGKSVGKS